MRDKLIRIIKSALSGWVLKHIIDRIAPIITDRLIAEGVVFEDGRIDR